MEKPIDTIIDISNENRSSRFTHSDESQKSNTCFNRMQKIFNSITHNKFLLTVILVSGTLLIMCLVAMAIILPLALSTQTTTTTTTTTTTSTTTTTTMTICVTPYMNDSSGNCVNILLNFDNCGGVGNICSNNYTSCSAGICSTAPALQLTNGTSIWTGGINGSTDDDVYNVTIPFYITIYNTTSNYIQLTTNGVLCLSTCSNAWSETSLPSSSFGAAVFPYWDDLYIYAKTWQGISYECQGSAPNRILIFNYYMSHYGSPTEYYQFQVSFFEVTPGVVSFTYFNVYDNGASCTVGVQGSYTGQKIQYSFNQINSIQANMTITFNTNTGAVTNSTAG